MVESRGADKDRIGDSQGALKLLESFKFRYETQTERELAKESGLYTGKEKLFLRYPNLHFPPKSIFNSINSPQAAPIYEGPNSSIDSFYGFENYSAKFASMQCWLINFAMTSDKTNWLLIPKWLISIMDQSKVLYPTGPKGKRGEGFEQDFQRSTVQRLAPLKLLTKILAIIFCQFWFCRSSSATSSLQTPIKVPLHFLCNSHGTP